MELIALIQDGEEIPLEGLIHVRIDQHDPGLFAGSEVVVLGRIHPLPPPTNPGERDMRRVGAGEIPAVLVVTDPSLLVPVEEQRPVRSWWLRTRSAMRGQLRGIIQALAAEDPLREALLGAVFLGERTSQTNALRRIFTSSGLQHLLAISGLHLAALAATATALVALVVPSPRLRLILVGTIVIGYAALLDPRTSVQRAGITMGIVIFGSAFNASWRPAPLVALVGVVVLWLDPTAIRTPGFQLSFGVTLALVCLFAPARRRWFGPQDRIGSTRRSMAWSWLMDAITVATIAWLVSTPIVMHHFGRIAPMGIPASMAALLPMSALLGVGYPLIGLGVMFEPMASLGGHVLAPIAQALVWVAACATGILPAMKVAPPPAWVTLVAVTGVILACVGRMGLVRRIGWCMALTAIGLPLLQTRLPNSSRPYEVLALDVGNGSAILVRCGRSAVLFDAGSTSIPSLAERVILPALHAVGVRRLDALVISHANLDHVSAVPEVLDAIPVNRVVTTPHLLHRAGADPDGIAGAVVHAIDCRGIDIAIASRGDTLQFGRLRMHVLHPRADEECRTANDESLVALVESPGHRSRILLCGDAQDEAIARVLKREPDLRAEIMELPHHGSWRPIAVAFVQRVDPTWVIQSTGPLRMHPDRWAEALGGRERGVTSRDGALERRLE